MALELKQSLKMNQRIIMTPQLQQAIKFLQLSRLELSQTLNQEMEAMLAYDWPGNVRELENVIKRVTVLCDGQVANFEDLSEHIQQNSRSIQPGEEDILEEGLTLDEAVKDYEKRLILEALEKSNWVKTNAAKLLHINRTTLVEKIKKQKLP